MAFKTNHQTARRLVYFGALATTVVLVPISEVGSVASAMGWLAACAAYYRMGPTPHERFIAAVGVTVGLLMILMKIVPGIPGHFSAYEWLALGIWSLMGLSLNWRRRPAPTSVHQ